MAKSSRSETRRSLRVGVIQNGKVIEEILVRDPRPIYVGTDPENDLVVGPNGTPSHFLLFEPSGQDAYTVHVGPEMTGEVEIENKNHTISPGQNRALSLADKTRGKITMGQTVVVFEFVDAPPVALLPPLPGVMKAGAGYIVSVMFGITLVLFTAFLLSGLLHGTLVALGYLIPPPPRNDGELVLNARLTRIMTVEEVEEDDTDLSDLDLDEDSDLVVEKTDDDSDGVAGKEDSEDTRTSSKGSGAAGGDADGAITGLDRVVQGSAFGALMDGEGGFNIGIGGADSASERSAAEALMNQAASGASGGGAVAKNLGSIGSGSGDGSGRIGIGGDGDSAVKSAAKAEGASTDQKQVTVKADVGDRGSRVAGSGTLSESNVKGVLGRFRKRVERCYQRTLSSNPSAGGRVELQFRVDANGQTTDARLPTNELGDTFGNCIMSEVRRLRFEKPSGGGPVTVSQRYVLQPSN